MGLLIAMIYVAALTNNLLRYQRFVLTVLTIGSEQKKIPMAVSVCKSWNGQQQNMKFLLVVVMPNIEV